MASLQQARTMGGVGSILILLGAVPAVGWLIAIAGAVLVLVAIKNVSDTVGDTSIFRNMLIAVVLAIVGLVVGVAVILSTVLTTFGLGALSRAFGGVGNFTPPANIPPGDWVGLILGVLAGLAVVWILLIISAVFVRMSYRSIASKLGVSMFATSGLLYLIGSALTIILVGFVLIFVSEILNIVAFFSIPDQLPQMQQQPMQPQAPSV
jgi:uncharacterized membrane protein